jgi:NADPH:quinone reductase-like Zn-dependent oxidoreductase
MRALVSTGTDALVELREVPGPEPDRDEAVVDVHAISLNRGESHRLAREAGGWRPGWDFAGVVREQARDGSGPPAGTRVVGWLAGGGAWAAVVAAPTDRLAPLPDAVSFADASTLPVAGLTALRTLRLGGLLVERRVLVTGAAGGVGRFAVELAARAGASVAAIVGRPERGEGLRELGAGEVLTSIEDAAGPYDLVLESVGGASLARALAIVGRGGTVVSLGHSSREPTTFDVGDFFRTWHASLVAFMLFAPERESYADDLALLAGLVARGELHPHVGLEAPWEEAGAVVRALLDRQIAGKGVLLARG